MSASAFQRLDSCSAVKQKNEKPFGKLIRLGKLFRFLMQLRWQKFNIPLAWRWRVEEKKRVFARLSPATRGLVLEQVQTGGAGFSSRRVTRRRCFPVLFNVTAQATRFMSGS